ncbi:DNA-packaging protein [Henriciella aquimarina]|uniref:DNA-packaging protein n=1 Tax=Henriciella aquimarina TaxID=545261 RepID=UPI001F24BF31|nr:terminase family protein [Henriciella aquimarina]
MPSDRLLPFALTARPAQLPPPGDWRAWLFMGGRGAGKTRAGAEWVRFAARFGGCRRIALIGPTFSDVREVMIEGVSGLRAITRPDEKAPHYEVSRHRLVWPNGAEAFAFSAEDADGLRGPQFDAAWCDEVAAWRTGEAVWDMLQMALRLGPDPRVVATTTPKPVPLVRRLVGEDGVAVTRARTMDNSAHLSAAFLTHVEASYAGTRLGRQELEGELLEEAEGALWTRAMLAQAREGMRALDMTEIIVAVDPPATVGPNADACGIIAAGAGPQTGEQRHGYVLADASVRGLSPLDWARRVVDLAASVGASRIVAEANQGGEMVRTILKAAGGSVPIVLRHARLSKRARAAPVAVLYEKGCVSHLGELGDLEDEMLVFGTPGWTQSPDRVDALVWALTALLLELPARPGIHRL